MATITNTTSVNYGQDTYDLFDLPDIDTQVISLQNIALRVARRLTTPYGALGAINDDPDFGYDIYQLLNGNFTQNDLITIVGDIENEILKDETIQSATVDISILSPGNYDIVVDLIASTGPFQLVLSIGDVNYNILTINEA